MEPVTRLQRTSICLVVPSTLWQHALHRRIWLGLGSLRCAFHPCLPSTKRPEGVHCLQGVSCLPRVHHRIRISWSLCPLIFQHGNGTTNHKNCKHVWGSHQISRFPPKVFLLQLVLPLPCDETGGPGMSRWDFFLRSPLAAPRDPQTVRFPNGKTKKKARRTDLWNKDTRFDEILLLHQPKSWQKASRNKKQKLVCNQWCLP